MVPRQRYATSLECSSRESVAAAQAHLAALREARAHHRAITLEIRNLFDAVAAEAVPSALVNALDDGEPAETVRPGTFA